MKLKINRALENTIAELDESYLTGSMNLFLADLDNLVLSTMVSVNGLPNLKNLVTRYQDFILDFSIQLLANLAIEGLLFDELKGIIKHSLVVCKSNRTLTESTRKLLQVPDNITDDTIIMVLFLTKLNIRQVINLASKYKNKYKDNA